MLHIQKMYRGGSGNHWHDITEDDVIGQTEVQGWYERGTVLTLLSQGIEIRTPYAVFRNADVKQRRHVLYGSRAYVRRAP